MFSFRKFDYLQKITLIVVTIWIITQLVVVLKLNNMLQWPDARMNYIPNSLWHFEHGTFYPTAHNLYDNYIQSIGYVNLLVVLLHLFGSFKAVMMVNVLMNVGIVECIYYLGKKFFSKKVACVAVLLYCLLLSNLFIPLYIMSDLPSLFFSLLGFCLVLRRRWIWVIVGGLLIGYAHTVRFYEIAFVLPLLYYMLKNRYKWYLFFLFLLPYFGVIHSTGIYSRNQTGIYVTSATTNGFGLVKIALGNGKGDVGNKIFSDTTNPNYQGLPDTYSFAQKDSIWKERARPGLKSKALIYTLYFPARVKKLFMRDTFFIPETYRFNSNSCQNAAIGARCEALYRLGILYNNLIYYIVIFFFVISLCMCRKDIFLSQGIFLAILSIMVCGFAGYIAEERYHYPCIFIMCLWGAHGIDYVLHKNRFLFKHDFT